MEGVEDMVEVVVREIGSGCGVLWSGGCRLFVELVDVVKCDGGVHVVDGVDRAERWSW